MSLFEEVGLESYSNNSGKLEVFNSSRNHKFLVKRFYLIRDVPTGERRGHHAHKELNQIFFCIQGKFRITLSDGVVEQNAVLHESSSGIIVPAGLWRELSEFSKNAICLVLASEEYNPQDYIHDYKEFIDWKEVT